MQKQELISITLGLLRVYCGSIAGINGLLEPIMNLSCLSNFFIPYSLFPIHNYFSLFFPCGYPVDRCPFPIGRVGRVTTFVNYIYTRPRTYRYILSTYLTLPYLPYLFLPCKPLRYHSQSVERHRAFYCPKIDCFGFIVSSSETRH